MTWQRVRTRLDQGRKHDGLKLSRRPLTALLSGTIRCPHCDELLNDDAVALFDSLVQERLQRLGGHGEVLALEQRRQELQEELQRLVEAIAQLGLSTAIGQRIRAVERELQTIKDEIQVVRASSGHSLDTGKAFKELLVNLESALQASPTEARHAVSEILGPVKMLVRGPQIWAQIATGPALQIAIGARGCMTGCGGRI